VTALSPLQSAERTRAIEHQQKRIGILVVAYNAVTTLSKVLRRIPAKVWDLVEEVAVFDDASSDDTFALGQGFKTTAGLEKLTVIRNAVNLGYGGNQKRGYRYFIEKGFDIVVLLHGDGQYAPEILEDLFTPLAEGKADAVFGSRIMPEYGGALKGGMPLYKFVGNRILTFFENRILDMRLTEFHSGYRAYSLAALRNIDFSQMTDEFHFDTEIIIKLHHQGYKIKEVPIPTYYGGEISYVNGMKYARDVFWSVVHYRRTLAGSAKYPEYAEFSIHYPLKSSKFSSHYYFERLAGSNHDVLDLGCGEGFFAARIAEAGNRVVGVDVLPEPKEGASLSAYVQADLEQGLEPVLEKLGGRKFDIVILQDVLEHLHRPELVLKGCAKLLKSNGRLLVSVPNIANITVRLALLFGYFQYTERGIMDRSHLRFYTRRTARAMLENSGFDIEKSFMSIMPVELGLTLPAHNPMMKVVAQVLSALTRFLPGLLGYQCIFIATPRRARVDPQAPRP